MERIASRIARYDFRTKMRINSLVLEEIAKAAGLPPNSDEAHLKIMTEIEKSHIHETIQKLADSISEEAEQLKAALESDL